MNLNCSVLLGLVLVSAISIACSSSAGGTPTRFVTDEPPDQYSRTTVHDSKHGNFMPSVANGYVGTVIYSDSVHVSGVYSGRAYPKKYPIYPVYLYEHPHRARIPSTASFSFKINGIKGKSSYALDVSEGVFYRWFKAVNLTVEQRIYAHRTRKNLLVVEITAKNDANRNFSMSLVPNMGYVTKDINFFMTESYRGDALAATGLVCLYLLILLSCNAKN